MVSWDEIGGTKRGLSDQLNDENDKDQDQDEHTSPAEHEIFPETWFFCPENGHSDFVVYLRWEIPAQSTF